MRFYHATAKSNFESIMLNGIKPGCDGIVYLCKTPIDALKFVCIRAVEKPIVFEVELKEKDTFKTFDHSEQFFKCRCYGTKQIVKPESIIEVRQYDVKI